MKPVSRVCPVCECHYEADPVRLRHGRQTTCGRACSYQLRAAGSARPILMSCPVCTKQFVRSPSTVKSKHQSVYCSRACHYAGRSLGLTRRVVITPYVIVNPHDHSAASKKTWKTRRQNGTDRHTEATRERLREATSQHIASQPNGIHVSKLEDKVAEELTRRGVPFTRQVAIRNPTTGRFAACVDFLLRGRVVLEVNGTFWHADPRFYPDGPTFPAQLRTATAYARKLSFLTAADIPLVEVWEADITKGIKDAVGHALKSAGL